MHFLGHGDKNNLFFYWTLLCISVLDNKFVRNNEHYIINEQCFLKIKSKIIKVCLKSL